MAGRDRAIYAMAVPQRMAGSNPAMTIICAHDGDLWPITGVVGARGLERPPLYPLTAVDVDL